MKKLSKVNESVWADLHRRSNGDVIRKEDGKKVSTCLGVDIIIKDSSCKYDYWIKEILEKDPNLTYGVSIDNVRYMNFSPDEMVNISNWKAPFDYLIYDGKYGDSLIADFYSYDNLVEYEEDIAQEVSEEDYISLCRGIATKLKEVGQYFSHAPATKSIIIGAADRKCEYGGDYLLKLIDEGDVYSYACDNDGFEIEEFIDSICDNFPELRDEDFIGWTFYDGCNIALPANLNNLVNFKKYREYTRDWFNA